MRGFNEDLWISRIIWRGSAVRSQLENDRVLNAYFLSSLVIYSAKLTSCNIDFYRPSEYSARKCNFGFARYLPRKRRGFVKLGEVRFKVIFKMQKHFLHRNMILIGVVSIPLVRLRPWNSTIPSQFYENLQIPLLNPEWLEWVWDTLYYCRDRTVTGTPLGFLQGLRWMWALLLFQGLSNWSGGLVRAVPKERYFEITHWIRFRFLEITQFRDICGNHTCQIPDRPRAKALLIEWREFTVIIPDWLCILASETIQIGNHRTKLCQCFNGFRWWMSS
jgi:hypothetical protein